MARSEDENGPMARTEKTLPSSNDEEPHIDREDPILSLLLEQLLFGCDDPQCSTSTCWTSRRKSNKGCPPPRQYSVLSARAISLAIASQDNPRGFICPYVVARGDVDTNDTQAHADPKSITQHLGNRDPIRSLFSSGLSDTDSTNHAQRLLLSTRDDIKVTPPISTPEWSDLGERLRPVLSIAQSGKQPLSEEQAIHLARLHRVMSKVDNLAQLCAERFDREDGIANVWGLRIAWAFRKWSVGNVFMIHGISSSIRQLHAEVRNLKDASPGQSKLDAFVFKFIRVVVIALIVIRCWDFYAFQQNDFDGSETPASVVVMVNWLLDALQDLLKYLDAQSARGHSPVNHSPSSPSEQLLRGIVWCLERTPAGHSLIYELPRSEEGTGEVTMRSWWIKLLAEHSTNIWDGAASFAKYSTCGTLLRIFEADNYVGKYLCPEENYEVHGTPVIKNRFRNLFTLSRDWMAYQPRDDKIHILSCTFLDLPVKQIFRACNDLKMRQAYSAADFIQLSRQRLNPRPRLDGEAAIQSTLRVALQHYLILRVSRSSALTDAFDQLWQRQHQELLRPLRVRMGLDEGEIGHDLGGVQVEFFKLICEQAFNPAQGLFVTDPTTKFSWFKIGSLEPLYKFELMGILFGLAVYNGINLPVAFPLVFYHKLLGKPGGLSFFEDGWPDLSKSLTELTGYEDDVEEVFARDFVYGFEANGLLLEVHMQDPWHGVDRRKDPDAPGRLKVFSRSLDRHHQLQQKKEESAHVLDNKLDGTSLSWPGWTITQVDKDKEPVPVTNDNRKEYALHYAQWTMDWSIRPQFRSFAKGFFQVVDRKILSILNANDLRELVEGHHEISFRYLKWTTTYSGYTAEDEVIKWFWSVVQEYDPEQLKLLLEFVTASTRLPSVGTLFQTFRIERVDWESDSLPGSSTCFGTLRLPEYPSREILAKKLDIALEHSLGFGQA